MYVYWYLSLCFLFSPQLQGARILGIPVIVTEQYPKGLGSTVQEIDLTGVKLVLPKTKFSMVLPEVEAALAEIPGVRSVVLFGVEVSTTCSVLDTISFVENLLFPECNFVYRMCVCVCVSRSVLSDSATPWTEEPCGLQSMGSKKSQI